MWCYGAQSYRPFGTAAEYTVVPLAQAVPLPEGVPFEQGACLGIPGITAHRAVHVAGPVQGRTVLVQGGAGAVGACAVQLAHRAGARVIATSRSEADKDIAQGAAADKVLLTGEKLPERIHGLAPEGVHHIVEVAFAANIDTDVAVLAVGGSIGAYATNAPRPETPFWQLVLMNARVLFIGSDDIPAEAKTEAARAINGALEAGWKGLEIAQAFPLNDIAQARAGGAIRVCGMDARRSSSAFEIRRAQGGQETERGGPRALSLTAPPSVTYSSGLDCTNHSCLGSQRVTPGQGRGTGRVV